MTGPEHYREAEKLLGGATTGSTWPDGSPVIYEDVPETIAAAQVHATLAHAAATALEFATLGTIPETDAADWHAAVAAPVTTLPGPVSARPGEEQPRF